MVARKPGTGAQGTVRPGKAEPLLVSFDIFDTLITRRVATPRGIFSVMRHRLSAAALELSSALRDNFVAQRVAAECDARRVATKHGREEITLAEIYEQLALRHRLAPDQTEALVKLEIELELHFVAAVPEMLRRFNEYQQRETRLILISDMYLPIEVIEEMLDRADPRIRQYAKIYLSNHVGLSKRSGSLFKHVLGEESVPANRVLHIGDNTRSDFQIPRRLGIATESFQRLTLKPWEQQPTCSIGDIRANVADFHWEIIAGLGRIARLSDVNDRYLLGYSIAGPILVPFVLWIFRQAIKVDNGTLYFIARDGQVLNQLAEILRRRLGRKYPIQRYLYGSRQAFNLPATRTVGPREITWIFKTYHKQTIHKLSSRIGMTSEEFRSYLPDSLGLPSDDSASLSSEQLIGLKKQFQENEPLTEAVLRYAEIQRKLVLEYLSNQGLTDDEAPQLVDIGWAGTIQDALFEMLSSKTADFVGYFFGVVRATAKIGPRNRKVGFMAMPDSEPDKIRTCAILASVLEAFTAADHGSVMGYRRDEDGSVVPIMDDQHEAILDWGLEDFRRGLLQFAYDLPLDLIGDDLDAYGIDFAHWFARLIRQDVPDKEIAECLGTFPFTPEQDGNGMREMAPRLSSREILRFYFDPRVARNALSVWPQGSYVRSEAYLKVLIHPYVLSTISRLTSLVVKAVVFVRWPLRPSK
ncbi:hypothetical protein AB1K70_15365 [Bremerella sp. JC770]|uniref:HAD family hydrolase n=1 Tax=Bremerella sp. JC770 TaxID=3232137 RepID=UPI003458FE15